MAPPRLYILHPAESRLPGITEWLAAAEARARSDATWDSSQIIRIEFDEAGSFHVPTVADRIQRAPGPVLLVQKVQHARRAQLEGLVGRTCQVIANAVYGAESLWNMIEAARAGFEQGQPLIPVRELVAYRIVRKLAARGCWGGEAKNKAFLWEDDLPNGGFPGSHADRRLILDVADNLLRHGVLTFKTSEGKRKFALGGREVAQPILDSMGFASVPSLRSYFERDATRVSVRLLSTE